MNENDTTAIIRVKELQDAKTIMGILVENDYSVMIEKEEVVDYEDWSNYSVYAIVCDKISKEAKTTKINEDDETC